MGTINTDTFLHELNLCFRSEIEDSSEFAYEVLHEDLTLVDAMKMLKDLIPKSTLASDISYAISSACASCAENFVLEQLKEMSLFDEAMEEEYNCSESEGAVKYDEDNDEFFFTGRIKTFARLYPEFSESELRDKEKLEAQLSELVKCGVTAIRGEVGENQ